MREMKLKEYLVTELLKKNKYDFVCNFNIININEWVI